MSTYTRKKSQDGHNIPEQRQENVYKQVQYGGVSCQRATEVGHPFPNKPVYHRKTVSPRTQEDSFDLHDFEKITITKQPKALFLPQEHNLNGSRKITESRHPGRNTNRPSSGDVQMAEARAIHVKKLMVQEKLRRVEEITRQKIQRDSIEAAAGNDEMMNREDFKVIRGKQDQRNEDRMRNTHEEEGARWRRREIGAAEFAQSKMTGNKDTVHKKKVSGELNKYKCKNVTEHTRGKRDEDQYVAHARQYMEKMYKDMQCSYDEQDTAHPSQEELGQRQNHRGSQCRTSGESTLPLVFGKCDSSRPDQKKELAHMGGTNTNIQHLTCTICNRKFNSDRLEKHARICEKVHQSRRQVFNSYVNRTKGSAIEQYWKTHNRSKTPEVGPKRLHPHKDLPFDATWHHDFYH